MAQIGKRGLAGNLQWLGNMLSTFFLTSLQFKKSIQNLLQKLKTRPLGTWIIMSGYPRILKIIQFIYRMWLTIFSCIKINWYTGILWRILLDQIFELLRFLEELVLQSGDAIQTLKLVKFQTYYRSLLCCVYWKAAWSFHLSLSCRILLSICCLWPVPIT